MSAKNPNADPVPTSVVNIPVRVVRPSGIWDTRTPLEYYFCECASLQKTYALLTCVVERMRGEAKHAPTGEQNLSEFLRGNASGAVALKASSAYSRAWRRLDGNGELDPSIEDVERDLARTLRSIREFAIVRYSALFESFVHCWALNMLLASLETSRTLSNKQMQLINEFTPIGKQGTVKVHGLSDVLKVYPAAFDALKTSPHIRRDKNKELVQSPIDPRLNAWAVVSFWRDYRNLLVHRDGVIDKGFQKQYSRFFELLRAPYPKLKPLTVGQQLQMKDFLYYAVATTHNLAAEILNSFLMDASKGRRGNHSPTQGTTPKNGSGRTNMLLTAGDHSASLAWVAQFGRVANNEEMFES